MNNDVFQIITIISLIVIAVMVGLSMKKNHRDNFTLTDTWVYYQATSDSRQIVYSILQKSGNDFIDVNNNQVIWSIISDSQIKYMSGSVIPYMQSGQYISFAENGMSFGLTPLQDWLRGHGLTGKNLENICKLSE